MILIAVGDFLRDVSAAWPGTQTGAAEGSRTGPTAPPAACQQAHEVVAARCSVGEVVQEVDCFVEAVEGHQ